MSSTNQSGAHTWLVVSSRASMDFRWYVVCCSFGMHWSHRLIDWKSFETYIHIHADRDPRTLTKTDELPNSQQTNPILVKIIKRITTIKCGTFAKATMINWLTDRQNAHATNTRINRDEINCWRSVTNALLNLSMMSNRMIVRLKFKHTTRAAHNTGCIQCSISFFFAIYLIIFHSQRIIRNYLLLDSSFFSWISIEGCVCSNNNWLMVLPQMHTANAHTTFGTLIYFDLAFFGIWFQHFKLKINCQFSDFDRNNNAFIFTPLVYLVLMWKVRFIQGKYASFKESTLH